MRKWRRKWYLGCRNGEECTFRSGLWLLLWRCFDLCCKFCSKIVQITLSTWVRRQWWGGRSDLGPKFRNFLPAWTDGPLCRLPAGSIWPPFPIATIWPIPAWRSDWPRRGPPGIQSSPGRLSAIRGAIFLVESIFWWRGSKVVDRKGGEGRCFRRRNLKIHRCMLKWCYLAASHRQWGSILRFISVFVFLATFW